MAKLLNGLFGPITGKLGNTVAYRLLDKNVIRIIGKNEQPPSHKQLVNRSKMAVVNRFLKAIGPFIAVGFKHAAKTENMYPQNKAVSYNRKNAVTGEYPLIEMDYARVRVSIGNLQGLEDAEVEITEQGLKFSWNGEEWMGRSESQDQVMMLAYFPETCQENGDQIAYYILSGARRIIGQDILQLPPALLGERMEVYVAMISDDRKRNSDSQYLGRLN